MKRGECDDGSVLDVPHRKYCARRKVVFQNFVEDVSEIFGRKYDVRVWALVTSVDPLRPRAPPRPHEDREHDAALVENGTFGAVKPLEDDCAHIKLLMNPSCGVKSVAQFTAGMEPEGYPFGIHTGNDGGADIIFTDYGARSLLQIAGVDDFEAPAYADKLDAAICAFCGSRDGTPRAPTRSRRWRAVHEEAHAGPTGTASTRP
ncbi:hypothetical protein JL720_3199 [Aureococcus anophagefferens]|nr:hypothetical protein JL720_3199 [Aureococcus anophagefferens]